MKLRLAWDAEPCAVAIDALAVSAHAAIVSALAIPELLDSDSLEWLHGEVRGMHASAAPAVAPVLEAITAYLASCFVTTRAAEIATINARDKTNTPRVQPETRVTTLVRGYPYPEELRSLTDFADTSWGNDVVDSVVFSVKGVAYLVWIDAESPTLRTREWGYDPELEPSELNPCPARYALCSLEINGTLEDTLGERQVSDEILETDDENALMEAVRKLDTAKE